MLLLPFLLLDVALMTNGVDRRCTPLVTRTTNMTNKVVTICTSCYTSDKIIIVPQNDDSINVCSETSNKTIEKRNDLFKLHLDAWNPCILEDGWYPSIAYIVRDSLQENRDIWYAVPRFCEKHLCILMMSDYYLGVLKEISIEENNSFIKLDLSKNNIGYIRPRCFQKLKKLEVLHLRDNKITYLKMNVFAGLDNIREISVSNNNVLAFGWRLFSMLGDSLAKIDLSHNKNLIMMGGCFNSSSLRYLNLSNTGMRNINQEIFKGVPNLERLDLSWNEISDPSSLALRHLQMLNLSGNRLAIINSTTFINLPELQYLTVRMMKVTLKIPNLAVQSIIQLKELDIRNNPGLKMGRHCCLLWMSNCRMTLSDVYSDVPPGW